jgi:hypothetical protein
MTRNGDMAVRLGCYVSAVGGGLTSAIVVSEVLVVRSLGSSQKSERSDEDKEEVEDSCPSEKLGRRVQPRSSRHFVYFFLAVKVKKRNRELVTILPAAGTFFSQTKER